MSNKKLNITDSAGAAKNIPDLERWGDPDTWKLICKASSQHGGWMKSTKAMEVSGGCLVQVSTQQRNPDGSWVIAEALSFVPDVEIEELIDDNGNVVERRLVQ